MAHSFEDGEKREKVKPTKAQPDREYPVKPHEARDVAIRRLQYRDVKTPGEWAIWLEFRLFPDVLGRYVGNATPLEQHEFEDRYRYIVEQRERRAYGRVVTQW
jgi:hypothetical protein